MKKRRAVLQLLCALMIVISALPSRSQIMPAGRMTVWNPGLNPVGGIPQRTTIYKTLTPSGGDDTETIQAAIDSCPHDQVVLLSPGTFNITGEGLAIVNSRITLRGSGQDQTKLVKQPGTNFPVIIIGIRWPGSEDQVLLAADALKETNSATLAGPPPSGIPLVVGELVMVDHLTDSLTWWSEQSPPGDPSRGWFCETDRPIGQVMEIQSVSGSQVTFTTSFHTNFLVADKSQLTRYWQGDKVLPVTKPVQWSGIEDLYVAYGEGGDGGGNIHLFATKYCWVKNVESDKSGGTSINLDGTFRCTVRDSYVHSTVQPEPGGGGYGFGINSYAADNLIENCISWNFNKVMVMRASGGGNVIGYNYMQDGWISYAPSWLEAGINASHMTTPHYELFEGNESFAFSADATWGNSVYITAFRNHLTTQRTAAGPLRTYSFTDENNQTFYYEDASNRNAIGLSTGHDYYSFIGNVLGSFGMSLLTNPKSFFKVYQTAFVYAEDGDDSHVPMWSLAPDDPNVAATVYRHGNYDYVTNSIIWDPSNTDHAIPQSLYLSSKPSFFGSNPWPWVTPENPGNPLAGTLPAKTRFETVFGPTGVDSRTVSPLPSRFVLDQNYPNPFNPATSIRYAVPRAGKVELRLYDLLGREVRTLVDRIEPAGIRTVKWDGKDERGTGVSSGMYFYRLTDGAGFSIVKKMILLR